MGDMNDLTRVKPVQGPVNYEEKKDTPYYLRPDSKDLMNPLIDAKMKGVKNTPIKVNKSDYSPSIGRDKT